MLDVEHLIRLLAWYGAIRAKYLEQTVQNQQLDIFTLQRDVRELQAKVEKEP
jgi:hypothetical protein